MDQVATKRVVIYARVSTKEQTVENQLRDLRSYCSHRGLPILAEHMDHGISGTIETRSGLSQAMELCRKRKADVLLVWRFDRLARSVSHLVRTLEELRGLGVDFVSYQENVDTSTPQGRMFFGIVASIAEFERELIRERVISGIRRAQADGIRLGRPDLPDFKAKEIRQAFVLLTDQLGRRASYSEVAARCGVAKSTAYKVLSRLESVFNPPQNVAQALDGAGVA